MSIPSWLDDVKALESKRPTHVEESPEWLEDLRLWVGLGLLVASKSSSAASTTTQSGGIPDWLESWLTPDESKVPGPKTTQPSAPSQPSAPAAELISVPVTSTASKATIPVAELVVPVRAPSPSLDRSKIATPQSQSLDSSPASNARVGTPINRQVGDVRTEKALPVKKAPVAPTSIAAPVQLPVAPPLAPPQGRVALAKSPLPSTTAPGPTMEPGPQTGAWANSLAEISLQETGVDVRTGQIVDPAKFEQWRRQSARSAAAGELAVSNDSLFDVFRKARFAIEAWVDEDVNRHQVMYADEEQIHSTPSIRAILQRYAGYGSEMCEKLRHHLAFMIENRRKYYLAIASRGQR